MNALRKIALERDELPLRKVCDAPKRRLVPCVDGIKLPLPFQNTLRPPPYGAQLSFPPHQRADPYSDVSQSGVYPSEQGMIASLSP